MTLPSSLPPVLSPPRTIIRPLPPVLLFFTCALFILTLQRLCHAAVTIASFVDIDYEASIRYPYHREAGASFVQEPANHRGARASFVQQQVANNTKFWQEPARSKRRPVVQQSAHALNSLFHGEMHTRDRERTFQLHADDPPPLQCGFLVPSVWDGARNEIKDYAQIISKSDGKLCHIVVVTVLFGATDRLMEPKVKQRRSVCFFAFVDTVNV